MDCPHCNASSPDGKKFCADCGSGLDAQAQRTEALVKTRVEEFIKEKFKDQKAVQNETATAVLDQVEKSAKQFLFFAGIPTAILLAILAVTGIEKYRDFATLVENGKTDVKQRIEQAKTEIGKAQSAASDAKSKADEAQHTTDTVTAEVNKELGAAKEITRNVQTLNARVSELEKQSASQMRASTEKVESQVKELRLQMDTASKEITEQSKKISSTDEIVKALFSKGTSEYFDMKANSATVVISPYKFSDKSGAFVFMLLKSPPIYQTLELKWKYSSEPRNSYGVIKNNVVFFNWAEPVETLRSSQMEVYYVPDPTSKNQNFKSLSVREGKLYADDEAIFTLTQLAQ
jgi:hypothetical protein